MVRYKGGDPLNISATAWNRMLDLVGYDVSATAEYTRGSVLYRWIWCKYMKNVSTVDNFVGRGAPVLIERPKNLTSVQQLEYETDPQNFIYTARPSAIDNYEPYNFGITLDRINTGEIGRVAIDGIVYANLKTPAGDPDFISDQMNFAVPLPFDDPEHTSKLRRSTSGFAQVIGSHVILNRFQNTFLYRVVSNGTNHCVVDIYGIQNVWNANLLNMIGDKIQSEVQLIYPYNLKMPLPLAIGDTGLCVRTSPYYGYVITNLGTAHNILGYTITDGTARSGNYSGVGSALLYRIENLNDIVPILDENGANVVVVYHNVSSEPVGKDKFVQLKLIGDRYIIDFEDCGTGSY